VDWGHKASHVSRCAQAWGWRKQECGRVQGKRCWREALLTDEGEGGSHDGDARVTPKLKIDSPSAERRKSGAKAELPARYSRQCDISPFPRRRRRAICLAKGSRVKMESKEAVASYDLQV
jgi:hypothetical protein